MDRRLELHQKLCNFLGSKYAYFQPPESLKLTYPCIIYKIAPFYMIFANNKLYNHTKSYEVTIIDKNPDSELPEKFIKTFPMVRLNRFFTADNLNHYVFILYY